MNFLVRFVDLETGFCGHIETTGESPVRKKMISIVHLGMQVSGIHIILFVLEGPRRTHGYSFWFQNNHVWWGRLQ